MIDGYERMRCAALRGGGLPAGTALSLFLERGMGAWVRFQAAAKAPTGPPQPVVLPRRGPGPGPGRTSTADRELVSVLTGIVWNRMEERQCRTRPEK